MDYGANDAATVATGTAFAGVAVIITILWIIFWLGGVILFIWTLIDCIRRNFQNPNDKTLWIILIVLLYWVGPILYLIIGRKKGTLPAK